MTTTYKMQIDYKLKLMLLTNSINLDKMTPCDMTDKKILWCIIVQLKENIIGWAFIYSGMNGISAK